MSNEATTTKCLLAFLMAQVQNQETEYGLKIQELNEQLEKKEAELDHKETIWRILVHDLKSPLWSIAKLIEMIIDSPEEDFSSILPSILQKMESIVLMIKNLEVWLNNANPEISEFNILKEIQESIKIIDHQAAIKNIKINVISKNPAAPETIFSYRNILALTLRNLLSNAIKFSHQNSEIIVFYNTCPTVSIGIQDFGVGINPEKIKQLLLSDSQLNSTSGTDGETGTGFGLKVCLEMIRKINGDIFISSLPQKGSTFTVKL